MSVFEPFEAFGDLGEIAERMTSEDPSVRRLAVLDLGETSNAAAVPLLVRAAQDTAPEVRQQEIGRAHV